MPGEKLIWPLRSEDGRFVVAFVRDGPASRVYFLYYIPAYRHSIQVLSFSTSKTKLLVNSEQTLLNLSVSPDEKWILYTHDDQIGSDLMLVENFR